MQVLVNTDNNIDGRDELVRQVEAGVEDAVGRFRDRITRIEVHLGDVNSDRKGGGDDMRCMMEARVEGVAPIAVTQHAATLVQAIDGAADKLERALDHHLGRLKDRRTTDSPFPPPPPASPPEPSPPAG